MMPRNREGVVYECEPCRSLDETSNFISAFFGMWWVLLGFSFSCLVEMNYFKMKEGNNICQFIEFLPLWFHLLDFPILLFVY